MVPPDRTKWRIKREPGAPYPSGSKSGAVPATVSGRECSLNATGYDPWEGEHINPDNREPEDLPDNLKPFAGAGVPKEDVNASASLAGQRPIRIQSHDRQHAGSSDRRQRRLRGIMDRHYRSLRRLSTP